MYVAAEHRGRGLAARLLDLALGDAAARLWVFEENLRAQRFYAKHRLVPSGQGLLDRTPAWEAQLVRWG